MQSPLRVIHFQRRPPKGFFSVERLFEDVRSMVPQDMSMSVVVNQYESRGFWHRFYDAWRAAQRQGQINHVTGDVHYLTYFLNKKKTILTILDCVTLERLKGIKRWIYWLLWYWLPEKRCTAITVISESTKKELLKYLNCRPDKVVVIHCPVSSEFRASPKPFNQACPRILQVGTQKNKNLLRVAQALKGIPCTLSIIGSLSEEQRNILILNGINFENYVDLSREELIDLYDQSDIVIFASLYEGFGLPIVESNAIGRPVITSNLYSMPEVGGNAAYYVNPYSPIEIRNAVIKIINDDRYRKQLVQRGFDNVKRFQLEEIANQYAMLYRKIAISAGLF